MLEYFVIVNTNFDLLITKNMFYLSFKFELIKDVLRKLYWFLEAFLGEICIVLGLL
jgi:hypothetical protein